MGLKIKVLKRIRQLAFWMLFVFPICCLDAQDSDSVFPAPKPVPVRISRADSLLSFAYRYLGDRYRKGGTGAHGFDCSGFTRKVFAQYGILLPHSSAAQGLMGFAVPAKKCRKGDLIFFSGRNRKRRSIGHVGIVISKPGEPVRFIHSSVGDGVRIDRMDADYYRKRFIRVARVLSP